MFSALASKVRLVFSVASQYARVFSNIRLICGVLAQSLVLGACPFEWTCSINETKQ